MVNKQTIISLGDRVGVLVNLLCVAASEADEREERRRKELEQ